MSERAKETKECVPHWLGRPGSWVPQARLSTQPRSLQLFHLEERRRLRLQQLATLIQKTYRGWRCRSHYRLMRKSQIVISTWFRGNTVPVPPSPSPSLS